MHAEMFELMQRALDADLRADATTDLQIHLQSCKSCADEWRALQLVHTQLRAAPVQSPSVGFDARVMQRIALRRRELTRASMAGITARYPFATVRVLALIYSHALGLKLAGAAFHRHPQADAA